MIWHASLSTACQGGKGLEISWCFSFLFCISHFQFVQAPKFYLTHLRNQCIAPNRSADKLKSFACKLTPAPGSICICTIMYLHIHALLKQQAVIVFVPNCICIYSLRKCPTGGKQFQFLFASPSVCSVSNLSRAYYYKHVYLW